MAVLINGMDLPDLKEGGITIFVYPQKNGNYIRYMDNNTGRLYYPDAKAVQIEDEKVKEYLSC